MNSMRGWTRAWRNGRSRPCACWGRTSRGLRAPRATEAPYGDTAQRLPGSLEEALAALQADRVLVEAFGSEFVDYFVRIKQSEQQRFAAAEDKDAFHRREYFGRI